MAPGPRSQGRHALIREAVREARLPIELSRLQVQLRHALEETAASRARLVRAADDERQRLQRDLHDGAQQRLVALGLDLRHAQHGLRSRDRSRLAVDQFQVAVQELRQLAHGLRPSALDDGLAAALRALVLASPLPVELDLDDIALSESATTAAYYVVAEALTKLTLSSTPAPPQSQSPFAKPRDRRSSAGSTTAAAQRLRLAARA